jgi:hypothetical protein
MKMRAIVPAVVLASLCGCATVPQTPIAATPSCTTDADCTAKWAAARTFVLEHAQMKIETYSADFLQTYNPPEYGIQLAASVNKEPITGGGYMIHAKFWCNNLFSCSENPRAALDGFNRYVAGISAPN